MAPRFSNELQRANAERTLELLLSPQDAAPFKADGWSRVHWPALLELARRNLTLVRTFDGLKELGLVPPADMEEAADREKKRISKTLELIVELSHVCRKAGVEFVFTKAFQHYPDMGHDVDLFVLDRSRRVDCLIRKAFHAVPASNSPVNRIAGKTDYWVEGFPSPVEVHHGRMGHMGEHSYFPGVMMSNRMEMPVSGATTFIPSPENQLIIQVLQRIYDHMHIRLSDIVHCVKIVQEGGVDWDYVVGVSRRIGVFDGLCLYLRWADQVYRSVFGRGLLFGKAAKVARAAGSGRVAFRGSFYRFPLVPVLCRVYGKKFLTDVTALNWNGMGTLCLMPMLAFVAGCRRLLKTADSVRGGT